MATTTSTRLLALAALGLTGALAGCTAATGTTDSGSDGSASGNTSVDTSLDTSAEYADGTYSATGSYTSPAPGTSQVEVEITLENDIVTAVTVTPDATDATSKGFQTQFANGISAAIVGADIDTLTVSRIGGSSLTSGGFNDALAQIKAEALA